jgi:hypothetical protein
MDAAGVCTRGRRAGIIDRRTGGRRWAVPTFVTATEHHGADLFPARPRSQEGDRAGAQDLSKDEGLLLDMEFVAGHMDEMYRWDDKDTNFLQVRMETLTADPYRQFLKIFDFLGLLDEKQYSTRHWLVYALSRRVHRFSNGRFMNMDVSRRLPVEKLLAIIWRNEFANKSGGRRPGQEDKANHYRKGSPGDWRNHFRDEHIQHFKERYNPLLLKLGYESDPNWT